MDLSWSAIEGLRARDLKVALRKACVTQHHDQAMEWPLNWFLPDSTTTFGPRPN